MDSKKTKMADLEETADTAEAVPHLEVLEEPVSLNPGEWTTDDVRSPSAKHLDESPNNGRAAEFVSGTTEGRVQQDGGQSGDTIADLSGGPRVASEPLDTSDSSAESASDATGPTEEPALETATSDGDDDAPSPESPRPRQPTYIETLERKLHEAQDQLSDYIHAYKKVKEEMDEVRTRLERAAEKDLEVLRGKLLTELLETLDNLDRSIQGGKSGWDATALLEGIELVRVQFLERLHGFGLTMIDPLGDTFDPKVAEAVGLASTDDPEQDNKVVQVYIKGFQFNERVIRPAKVVVGRHEEGN